MTVRFVMKNKLKNKLIGKTEKKNVAIKGKGVLSLKSDYGESVLRLERGRKEARRRK